MDGLINVLKPPGMSSHDVVNYMRRLTGKRKVGHTGTLDPGAAGVLAVCIGRATKIIEYLPSNKRYRAEIIFGLKTDSGDIFGEPVYEGDCSGVTPGRLAGVLPLFTGHIHQVPPMTSALKHKGKKLYELAREGLVVDRKPRPVEIFELSLISCQAPEGALSRALLDISCSQGTYIRTLCTDIGDRLGCGAHMGFLLRTAAGDLGIGHSRTLEELAAKTLEENFSDVLMDINTALGHMPGVKVNDSAARSVTSGARLHSPGIDMLPGGIEEGELVRLIGGSVVLAVARAEAKDDGTLCFKPEKVLAQGNL